MKDLTKNYDYAKLIEEEKEHYCQIEVTENLREGGPHASAAWEHYWKRVHAVIARTEFADLPTYLSRTLVHLERPVEILSLGSGYCGHELALARRMTKAYRLRCTDINEKVFERAKEVVRKEGLCVEFEAADLNFIQLEPKRYDLIFANASIHHVINLEHLFDQVARGLTDTGIFRLVEVVGKNRTLIWEENERLADALLGALPKKITAGLLLHAEVPGKGPRAKTALKKLAQPLLRSRVAKSLLRFRREPGGMEGIRQSEIVSHLRQHFVPLFEHRHGAFIRFVCTNSALTARFDPNDVDALRCLEFLIDADEAAVGHGILQPLEIWGCTGLYLDSKHKRMRRKPRIVSSITTAF